MYVIIHLPLPRSFDLLTAWRIGRECALGLARVHELGSQPAPRQCPRHTREAMLSGHACAGV